MWRIENKTPFAAERSWVRGRDGAEIWLVAVKATFDLQLSGQVTVASNQLPVTQVPIYLGAPGASSLHYDTDLPRTKITTDVLLIGSAHAPGGKPVTELDVGLAVNGRAKRLKVVGDRAWGRRGPSPALPFTSMPIVYERAFGGADRHSGDSEHRSFDMRNPVGTGWVAPGSPADGVALPNIEHPAHPIKHWEDRPPVAGFGPVACHWQPRLALAGTYGEEWLQTRMPLLPDDFNDGHYQCAPVDQRPSEFLRGGEPVVLSNLSPGGGECRFTLPRLHLGFETFFRGGERVTHPDIRLHSVILEPDSARLSLVWHSALPCHPKVLKLQRTRISLKQNLREGVLAPTKSATAAALA